MEAQRTLVTSLSCEEWLTSLFPASYSRPRWFFLAAGFLGATFFLVAASRAAFNLAALFLAAASRVVFALAAFFLAAASRAAFNSAAFFLAAASRAAVLAIFFSGGSFFSGGLFSVFFLGWRFFWILLFGSCLLSFFRSLFLFLQRSYFFCSFFFGQFAWFY